MGLLAIPNPVKICSGYNCFDKLPMNERVGPTPDAKTNVKFGFSMPKPQP